MIPNPLVGVFLALTSALTYGSADFFGGVATSRNSPFVVLTLSSSLGILPMLSIAILRQETFPPVGSLIWACLAGFAGTIGLVLLYYGLAVGRSVIVSPISGIACAALPVIFSAITQQIPTQSQLVGFIIALPAIFLVSQTVTTDTGKLTTTRYRLKLRGNVAIGLSAGVFFGLFFISLAQIQSEGLFFPLSISKGTACVLGCLISLISKQNFAKINSKPAILLAGILDPTANGLYLLSLQFTRLDIAAVLASLYPAGTVLLAIILQKEPITKLQTLGFTLCLFAIVLIAS